MPETQAEPDRHDFARAGSAAPCSSSSRARHCSSAGTAAAKPPSPIPMKQIEELDFHEWLVSLESEEETEDVLTVSCPSCGAELQRDPRLSSEACPFCATTIVAAGGSHKRIKPRSLLPFKVERSRALELFREWVSKLWFAPNDFKRRARLDTMLSGMYVPHWTYDAAVTTEYSGQRGTHYYVPVTRSTSKGTTTVMERRTSWSPVSGSGEQHVRRSPGAG